MDTFAYTVNCSILLTDLPLLQRPQAAREAGFDAVEFWWPFDEPVPADREVDAFVRAVEDAGVQLTGLNFAAGDMPAGDRGLLSNPAHTLAFRDNIDITVGIGERLGTKHSTPSTEIGSRAWRRRSKTRRPPRIWRWRVRRRIVSVRWCSSSRSAAHRRIR